MLIKESTLRRIIREEARRSLREDAVATTAAAPMTQQEFNDVGARIGLPPGTIVSIDVLRKLNLSPSLETFWKADDALNSALINLLGSVPASLAAAQSSRAILKKEGNDGALGKGIASYLANPTATTIGAIGCLIAGAANVNGPIFTGASGGGNLAPIDIIKTKDPGKLLDNGAALQTACQKDTSALTSLRTITSTSVRKMVSDIDAAKQAATKTATAAATAANTTPYTVKAGDTISKIAQARYGIVPTRSSMPMYDQLAATIKNRPGATANSIKPGDVINLPATLGGKALIAAK